MQQHTRLALLCLLWPAAPASSPAAEENSKPCGATTPVDFWNAGCDATKDHCWKNVHEYANVSAEPADCCALCKASPASNGYTHKKTAGGNLCLLKVCSGPTIGPQGGSWFTDCPTTPSNPAFPTASAVVAKPHGNAGGSSVIHIDPRHVGPQLDGLGGVSAGTGPRLLVDYPPEQRSAVLDYLFLPNFGASLQVLKVEIGGGGDSTEGTEASHEPERGQLQPTAGYELWVAAEALKRNPEILIYGLCWNFPSWVVNAPEGVGAAGARYMADWVEVAASQNVTVDVLGAWQNETPFNGTMVVGLREELDRRGYHHVRLAVGELRGNEAGFGEVPAEITSDPKLEAATSIIALHYATTESNPVLNVSRWEKFWDLKKPLWASEDYSTYSDTVGGKCLAKIFNRNYVDANITATFVWDLFWASFDGLACSGQGLIWSAEPWTGKFGVPDTVWAAAHTAQFTARGWHYLDKGAGGGGGYLPGRNPGTSGGTYVALASNDTRDDVTVVFETMDNNGSACAPGNAGWNVAAQESNRVQVCFAHDWCAARQLRQQRQQQPLSLVAFRTDIARNQRFEQLADVTVDAQCCFHANLSASSIHTFSTKRGATRGSHPDATVSVPEGANPGCGVATLPLAAPFPFPYQTKFNETGRFRDYPKYLSDINGVFRVVVGSEGEAVLRQQMLERSSVDPPNGYARSVIGSKEWTNFSVAVDATLPADANDTAFVCVIARIGHGYLFGPAGGYVLKLTATGAWSLLVGDHPTVLATGSTGSPRGVWRELRLTVVGDSVSGSIDGVAAGRGNDTAWADGLAGVASGFHNASFRALRIEALPLSTALPGPGGSTQ